MKTKYRIMQVMEELIKEHAYEGITIRMITEKVPIARQGFYKFYQDKEDLCRQMYLYYTDRAAIMENSFNLQEFIYHDLTEINRHVIFFSKLANQPYMFNDNKLYGILHGNVFKIYMKMLEYQLRTTVSDDLAFMLNGYCIGGLYQLVEILKKGKPLDVGRLTELYIEMMPVSVREILLRGEYPASIIEE